MSYSAMGRYQGLGAFDDFETMLLPPPDDGGGGSRTLVTTTFSEPISAPEPEPISTSSPDPILIQSDPEPVTSSTEPAPLPWEPPVSEPISAPEPAPLPWEPPVSDTGTQQLPAPPPGDAPPAGEVGQIGDTERAPWEIGPDWLPPLSAASGPDLFAPGASALAPVEAGPALPRWALALGLVGLIALGAGGTRR